MTNEKQKKVKPNKGRIIAICLASFVLVVLFVWLFASSRFTGVANGGIVMVVRYEGGLCPDNSMCSSEYKLYENGVFDGHDRASSQEISELQRVIDQTDFLQYDLIRMRCASPIWTGRTWCYSSQINTKTNRSGHAHYIFLPTIRQFSTSKTL